MKYRRDIDGLRAVAVILVVIYHARFVVNDVTVMKGGFVGVDVFFVISGFLITTVISKELEAGHFSIGNFYERRIRRIMPALLFLLAAAVPTGFLLLAPNALNEFSGSVPAAVLFYANVFFFAQDSYAAEPSQLKPLLHLWSLAVEEQFYLVFPPLMMLLWRARRQFRGAMLAVLFGFSLAIAQYLATRYTDANFFLLPSRAWELLAGSGLALYGARLRIVVGSTGRWLPTAGLLAIFVSALRFDDNTLHPSLWTLIPVLGAVAIIGFPDSKSWATRLLSSTWFVRVGLISYSLYLWHFTIFAFGRVIADGAVGVGQRIAWILLSLVMATISLRFVERPFRQPGLVTTRRVLGGVTVAALALGTVSTATFLHGANRSNIPPELAESFEAWTDPYSGLPTCLDQERHLDPSTWCRLGVSGEQVDFLLVGDSHAHAQAAVFDAGARAAEQTGLLVARSGCPSLLGLKPARGEPLAQDCLDLAEAVVDVTQAQHVGRIVLASRWNYYICAEPEPGCGFTQDTRLPDQPYSRTIETRTRYLIEALHHTVGVYESLGLSVSLLTEVPNQPQDARAIFDDAFGSRDMELLRSASVGLPSHQAFTATVREILADVESASVNASILDQSDVLCDGGPCPVGTADGSVYTDDNHLSIGAADTLREWAEQALTPNQG